MSYDLRLYRQNNSKKALEESELQKLGNKFEISGIALDKENKVKGFSVSYKGENEPWEFYLQDDGGYWTYVSYGTKLEYFKKAKQLVKDVAFGLGLLVQDPQSSEELVRPNEFNVDNPQSNWTIDIVRNKVLGIPLLARANVKYFVLYFILSVDPTTSHDVMLTLGKDKYYASNVNVGESLLEVIKKDIAELTGSSEFKVIKVQEDYGVASDKTGNQFSQAAVYIQIPYFNPKETKVKYPIEWKDLKSSRA